jgi:2-dehydro-3-deoxyphosphogluconate aldolase/(4S)-4-hydroxy-2-oxoglutarate aldolase
VLACGGSWLTPAAAIFTGDYAQITTLAQEALKITAQARRDNK